VNVIPLFDINDWYVCLCVYMQLITFIVGTLLFSGEECDVSRYYNVHIISLSMLSNLLCVLSCFVLSHGARRL